MELNPKLKLHLGAEAEAGAEMLRLSAAGVEVGAAAEAGAEAGAGVLCWSLTIAMLMPQERNTNPPNLSVPRIALLLTRGID